ncbi:MAG: hypothetical protein Q7V05_13275 [Methanoregula sp.]|nr:hypothetical protein [Methanoregula sp.]
MVLAACVTGISPVLLVSPREYRIVSGEEGDSFLPGNTWSIAEPGS